MKQPSEYMDSIEPKIRDDKLSYDYLDVCKVIRLAQKDMLLDQLEYLKHSLKFFQGKEMRLYRIALKNVIKDIEGELDL